MKKFKIFLSCFVLILFLFNYKIVKVQGDSMKPMITSGSIVVADRYLHKLFPILKDDILLVEIDNKEVVKKVVGFPNEKIEVEDKKIKLSNDEIYLLGENLEESIDSREYGPVKVSKILGKVVLNF